MSRNIKRNLKENKDYSRKQGKKTPKKAFIISCEGACTEPNYIKGLVEKMMKTGKIAKGSVVLVPHQNSDPEGVLNNLLNTQDYSEYDEKWVVFDRDEIMQGRNGSSGHTAENFNGAIDKASKKKIDVAWSNPCFEFWLLLHFQYRETGCTRVEAQTVVTKNFIKEKWLNDDANIDDMKKLKNIYTLLEEKGLVDKALKNSAKLSINQPVTNPEKANPGTTFNKLVIKLQEYQDEETDQ